MCHTIHERLPSEYTATYLGIQKIPSKLLMISGTDTYSLIQLHTVKNSAGFSIQYIHFLIVVGYSPSIS